MRGNYGLCVEYSGECGTGRNKRGVLEREERGRNRHRRVGSSLRQ